LFGASDEDMKKEAVREKYRIENYQLNKKKKKLGASGLGLYFFFITTFIIFNPGHELARSTNKYMGHPQYIPK